MANKKARNKTQELDFDLPPSALAKTTNLSSTKARKRKSRSSKKSWETEDDTPKAFSRLISGGGAPPRSGLDNGDSKKKSSKKRKLDAADGSGAGEALRQTSKELKIQPGETLREFGRRVDAAIPVHFPRGDGSLREGGKKKNKKAKQEEVDSNEELEDGEEVHSDDDDEMKEQLRQAKEGFEAAKRRKKKRGDSPDPWADLEKKREAVRFGEVAPAPPTLKKPKALLYMAGAKAAVDVDGVPRSAGSLAKREELAGERRSVVEAYRLMMEGKREEGKKAR